MLRFIFETPGRLLSSLSSKRAQGGSYLLFQTFHEGDEIRIVMLNAEQHSENNDYDHES
jgi:hypothetical protein